MKTTAVPFLFFVTFFACSEESTTTPDAGSSDAGITDVSTPDVGTMDVGAADAEPHPKTAEIEAFVKPFADEGWFQSIAIAIIDGDSVTHLAYGQLSETDPSLPDETTVFEIGSISKGFTSLLLAEMMESEGLTEDTPVQSLLPAQVTMPKRGNIAISLAHLSTHFSGLPRMPTNFDPADPDDPYADYDAAKLYEFLNSYTLPRNPGAEFEYSNLAVGLLGHALARTASTTYEAVLTERILTPLDLGDTSITLRPAQIARAAPGHNADGVPVPHWDLAVLQGAGALRSTTADLVKLARAFFDPVVLTGAIADVTTPRRTISGPSQIGLGWFLFERGQVVFHDGGTGGFSSFFAAVPSERVAVIAITSSFNPVLNTLGFAMLDAVRDVTYTTPTPRPVVNVARQTLEDYVGTYRFSPLNQLEVTLSEDHLVLTINDFEARLYPESETDFYLRKVEADVQFARDGTTGSVTHLTYTQDGQSNRADRI